MIDVSKLPAGPWKRTPIHDVEDSTGRTIAITPGGSLSEALNRYAVASLLIWARSIVEPPQEVKEAMGRIRRLKVESLAAVYATAGAAAWNMCCDDQAIISNWTLKIFIEVQS